MSVISAEINVGTVTKGLQELNQLKISLASGLSENDGYARSTPPIKKYSVCDGNETEILKGIEIKLAGENLQKKTIVLSDAFGKAFYKIVHCVGVSEKITHSIVSICSVDGRVLGETTVSFACACCCVLKPRYTYRLKSGRDLFILNGRISCCHPKLKMDVVKEDGSNVGIIYMGNTRKTYQCDIKFTPENPIEDRLILVALCIGFLDSTYEKRLAKTTEKERRKNEEKNSKKCCC